MRKWHKKNILELLQTLNIACKELAKQKDENFVGLCGEMQNFVSGMFGYVEGVLGEGSNLAERLKTFYQMLYDAAQGTVTAKQLLKFVRRIDVEINGLKPDRIEIAFLCYKASMSDSFESVYLAAKEDPACDVYFIPIPYYDRNPDGSFGRMHLESEGYYSEKYELTNWNQYDLEAHHPDAVFIMNPYDANNYVTSVHPDFYSSELRKYTDLLIYIEYGIPFWIYRDHDAVFETVKKEGRLLPAYLYCDHYIAYSKEVIASFKALFRAKDDVIQACNRIPQKIDDKFVPLGSPKFDKVLSSRREEYPLIEEWNKKINGKKVVLYNCSLREFLKVSGEQRMEAGADIYFEKLRSIIAAFQNRNDVVLWWRPHPLFEVTLSSMRACLLGEYRSIVRDFRASNIGIFDATENLHRAITWSDAMISEESSLLFLYTVTGKPFYIPSIVTMCPQAVHDTGADFHAPLAGRLKNMRAAKGANAANLNVCIWWYNFLEEDLMRNTHFDNFLDRFIDYVVHPEKYPEAAEYRALQVQMFKDFVANADGTAGRKIYEFVKEKALT